MTLTTPYSATFYVGDGETKTFPYLFEEVSESFISVIVYNSLTGQSSTPTYIVDADQKQVIFGDDTPAPTADETVCIYRNTPNVQDTPFRTLQGYDAKALENILSKIVAMIQEIKSNYFSTQVLQGDPWQLDLLKSEDDGATVNIDFAAKKLVKGLYFKITSGNLQVSADGSNYITMPKSTDVAEFRQQQTEMPDHTYQYRLQYRVGNTWYNAESNAEATADAALQVAEEARDIASDAKDIAQDAKDIADTFDGRLTQAELDASDAKNTVDSHVLDYNNPHQVTASQVGLGNVDNTADLDKPISTATQSALDLKANLTDIGNATLTIQKNGTAVDSFTANASVDKTINITVPTQASDVNALPDTTKYGASLSLTINSSTFVITAQLKDQDNNNLGSAQTIDLPLESVVVSGSYDSDTKEVVLVLESGSEIRFSVADLVSGLQSEITADNMLDADLVDDSTATHKFVSATDKTTWNSHVANTSNPHSVTKAQVGLGNVDNTSDLNKPISTATQSALDSKVDKNAAISGATHTKITYDSKGLVTGGSDITLSDVTDVTATASEVNVLDGITATTTELNYVAGVTSSIQSQIDGKQATISDLATIRSNASAGKSASDTIATYGDIVTHDVAEFATAAQGAKADTALQAGDNVSELVNDAGYLVMGDLTNFVTKNTSQTISGLKTFTGDITLSGTTSIKNTTNGVSYTMLYRDASGIHVGTSTQALLLAGSNTRPKFNNNDIAMLSDIPTAVSQLTNDTGFITNAVNDLQNYTLTSDLATVATSGSYNDLSDKPTIPTVNNATLTIQKNGTTVQTFTANQSTNATANISVPTKTSDITNDSGFITSSTLAPYALSADLATVATTGDYDDLSNKPTIPTVGNGTITITQGGVSKGTFTTNQSGNTTIALDAGGGSGLPDQTGHAGEFLTTDGTDASWSDAIGYHPDLFDVKWADHVLNDVQWLRADTFSWQAGSVYQAAYQHLADDITGKTLQSETISGTTIQFYLADDGHKICPASEESNVTAIYNATGVAWYYILDTVNQRFKLPRTKFGFTGIRSGVGGYVEAGLPNITGSFTGGSNYISGYIEPDGAFSSISNTGNVDPNDGRTHANKNISFSASRSSSVYGNSDTVQPKATEMYLYFYVGNFTQTALENTAGLNASLFNGKADLDFANTNMIDYVVEKQDPNAGNNYTWYRKYKSGWVEQGGIVFPTTTSPTRKAVTLPVAMSESTYSVQVTPGDNAADAGIFSYYTSRTTTGFELLYSHTSSSYTIGDCWCVCGIAAN